MFGGNEKIEHQLMSRRPVNVFKIPPIASSHGHKAEDWRGQQMWTGFCKVVSEDSRKCNIMLINEDNSPFAISSFACEDYGPYVQRCIDSSRFFAILLINEKTGQKANVGVQFPERNDSFDFVGALDQFVKYFKIEMGISKGQVIGAGLEGSSNQKVDFSLKQGEKLTLKINGVASQPQTQTNLLSKGGLKPLKKPLGGNSKPSTDSNQFGELLSMNVQIQQPNSASSDLFDLLGTPQEVQVQQSQIVQQKIDDPFGFADFFENQQQPVQKKQEDLLGFDDLFGKPQTVVKPTANNSDFMFTF